MAAMTSSSRLLRAALLSCAVATGAASSASAEPAGDVAADDDFKFVVSASGTDERCEPGQSAYRVELKSERRTFAMLDVVKSTSRGQLIRTRRGTEASLHSVAPWDATRGGELTEDLTVVLEGTLSFCIAPFENYLLGGSVRLIGGTSTHVLDMEFDVADTSPEPERRHRLGVTFSSGLRIDGESKRAYNILYVGLPRILMEMRPRTPGGATFKVALPRLGGGFRFSK